MSKMKSAIEQFISEYSTKVDNCDVLINKHESDVRTYRQANDKAAITGARKELTHLLAQRQAYVQAGADFDSLLDYVNT